MNTIFPTTNNPDTLKAAVNEGPVVAVVQADVDFVFYQSGILDSDDCTSNILHPVLVVGYGTENDIDFFIIKNSWGTNWGENGYARVAVKPGAGVCGLQSDLLLPITN
jgi:C1A family cysteine protease